jgi:hypothetical protein
LMEGIYDLFKKGVDSFLFKTKKDAMHVIKTAPSVEQSKRKIENTLDGAGPPGQFNAYQILLDVLSKILDHTISIALSSLRRIM